MKVLLAIFLISFISIEAHGSRVKRGLSADEQKKFLDVLNKDRKEIGKKAGFNMNILKYDMALEKKADSVTCSKTKTPEEAGVPLQLGSVAQEAYEIGIKKGYSMSTPFFWPTATKIGCSKTIKCSITLGKEDVETFGEKLRGKTSTFHGVCFPESLTSELDGKTLIALNETGLPHPSKYGNLLGVPKPGEKELETATAGHMVVSDNVIGQNTTPANSSGSMSFELISMLFLVLFI